MKIFSRHLFNRAHFLLLCWALYDLANQFFALNMISVYFPRWLTLEKNVPEILYSLTFAASMIAVGVLAPFLGTVSDIQNQKKIYLTVFTLLSVGFTFLIGYFNHAALGLLLFIGANFSCQIAIIFYNSLLIRVAPREKLGLVSGIGRMFGYSGAILALYFSKMVIAKHGYPATFIVTAVGFLVFALPALLFIKEKRDPQARPLRAFLNQGQIRKVYSQVWNGLSKGAQFHEARLFLLVSFFSLCAIQTIILFMAIYAGQVFQLTELNIINLVSLSVVSAILGSFGSGFLRDRFGNKRMVRAILFLWVLGIGMAGLLNQPFHWIIGGIIGFALSATWVVGRAWAIELVPEENIGEIFGLYVLAGYLAGVIGPLFWGLMLLVCSPLGIVRYRISLLSLLGFMGMALYFLEKIPERRPGNCW